jgi:hypothetical protein
MGIFDKLFGKRKSKNPEDDYKVTVTEELILVEHPRRKNEQILWKDITEIKLINTDEGPWLPDVWLTLLGKDSGCMIPQGANGYDTIYDIVSKYEDFNFENVMKSMSCTDNMQFQLWTRTKEIRHTT